MSEPALQRIAMAAHHASLDPARLPEVHAALADLQFGDLGIARPTPEATQSWKHDVQFMSVIENPRLALSLWFLRQGAVIPLHNHPCMTAICRPLYGKATMESFQWVGGDATLLEAAPARVTRHSTSDDDAAMGAAAGPPSRRSQQLGPDSYNIHCIHAHSDMAMLDIFIPPYSDGRPCSYFAKVPRPDPHEQAEDAVLAASLDPPAAPDDICWLIASRAVTFSTGWLQYPGPAIALPEPEVEGWEV